MNRGLGIRRSPEGGTVEAEAKDGLGRTEKHTCRIRPEFNVRSDVVACGATGVEFDLG